MKSVYPILLHFQQDFPVKAKLKLSENNWSIEYPDEDDNLIVSIWILNDIERFQNPDGSTTFKHQQIPYEAFETSDQKLLETIALEYSKYSFSKPSKSVHIQQWQLITAVIGILIGTIAVLYFWLLPGIGLWAVNKIPVEKEIQLGEKLQASFLQSEKVDKELTELTQQFVDSIQFNSKYPIKVSVVNDTILNAFALPGGYIVVYSKMLQNLESYEQLAALLCHEVSHVTQRHSLHSLAENLSGMILLKLLFGNTLGFSGYLIDNINRLKQLSYSRELEREADEYGLKVMEKNNIDQKGMAGLLTVLQRSSKGSDSYSFLSTHPLSTERKKFALEVAAKQSIIAPHPFLESRFNNILKLLNE